MYVPNYKCAYILKVLIFICAQFAEGPIFKGPKCVSIVLSHYVQMPVHRIEHEKNKIKIAKPNKCLKNIYKHIYEHILNGTYFFQLYMFMNPIFNAQLFKMCLYLRGIHFT